MDGYLGEGPKIPGSQEPAKPAAMVLCRWAPKIDSEMWAQKKNLNSKGIKNSFILKPNYE